MTSIETPLKPSAAQLLLVDDDDILRTGLALMLARAGYDVLQAANVTTALEIYRRHATPLIISDIIIKERDGLELLMELRREPAPPKFIAISGGGRMFPEHYLRMAQCLGAHTVLAKPFPPEQLLDEVRKIIATN